MGQRTDLSFDKEIEAIFADWNHAETPGGAVAVVQKGKVLYSKGFGSADLEHRTPITSTTKFQLRALHNQIVAFAVLLLESDGKLSLNDDIRKYLPEMPYFEKPISIHNLLTHTHGLPDFISLQLLSGWNMEDQKTRKQALRLLYDLTDNVFNAGDKSQYCDSGILLASEIVSKVSGISFADFANSQIFKPLAMKNTVFGDIEGSLIQNRARIYSHNGDIFRNESLNFYSLIDFTLYSTVDDMALWMLNFETPIIGSSALIEKMNRPAVLNNGTSTDIVFGQYLGNYNGLHKLQQHGRYYGYTTYIAQFPDQDFGVVVLGNAFNFLAKEAALKITDLFLEKEFLKEKAPLQNIAGPKKEFIELSKGELEKFCGAYWNNNSSYSRNIYLKNGNLYYSRSEGNESELAPITKNTFVLTQDPDSYTIRFEKQSGEELMIFGVGNEFEYINEKYDPVTYDVTQLSEFAGVFLCKTLNATFNLTMQNGKLKASQNRKDDFTIIPYKTDRFTSIVDYFSNLEFVRENNGKIKGFWVRTSNVGGQFFRKTNN